MANKSNWKGTEREVAQCFGTKRAPVCNNQTHSDTFHDNLYIEIKKRKKFTLWKLFEDTKKKAIKENKIPVVAIKQKYKEGFLILCRPDDLEDIAEELIR